MNELSPPQKFDRVQPYLIAAGWIADPPSDAHTQLVQDLIVAAGDRIKTSGDVLDYPEFFLDDTALSFDDKAVRKRLSDPASRDLLSKFSEQLKSLNNFDSATLETTLKQWIESEGIGIGKIIHALRVAVTGRPVGLGIFETLAMVGKETVLRRIASAIEYAQKLESAQVVDPSS
jgi:glutamyl-tRNA synthetase